MIPVHIAPLNHLGVDRLVGRTTRRGVISLAIACMLPASCAPGSDLPPLPETDPGPYRLGAADQVRIVTYGEDRLTGQYPIDDNNKISIALIGNLQAGGLTTSELESEIKQRMIEKNILLDPSVSVTIVEYRPIFVLGEVSKPGQYPYQPGMTVLTAVAVAGGFSYRAQTEHASILRQINGHSIEGRVPRGRDVHPGDVITIFERYF
jgi:polysaccharide export outer membrane protein